MAALEARPAPAAATDVFKRGKYTAKPITTCNAPKTLFIVTPDTEGTYPVLLFLHGYNICPCCYTNLLEHISSHGYIVVAPRVSVQLPFPLFFYFYFYILSKSTNIMQWLMVCLVTQPMFFVRPTGYQLCSGSRQLVKLRPSTCAPRKCCSRPKQARPCRP